MVMLMPATPFSLKKPVQLVVYGTGPSGLQDTYGRLIDGNHDGSAGGNAVAVLKRGGATIAARLSSADGAGPKRGGGISDALDLAVRVAAAH
jgi:hypothetical protein